MRPPGDGNATSRSDTQTAQRRAAVARVERHRRSPVADIDLLMLAWKSRWLLLLGLLVGLAVGYFHYIQSPAMYRSSARVQIVESSVKNLPVEGLRSGASTSPLGDEALVMKSEGTLKKAAELGQLSATAEFAGMSPTEIAIELSHSEDLVIGPATESTNTNILKVQYDSTSPTTSQRVVQSVIDAYGMHLQEQYRSVGKETVELIQTAREEVLDKLTALENEYQEFKRDSALIYRDGEITSVHRDNADKYLTQQQSLRIQSAQLSSMLEAARKALNENRPAEAVLMALHKASAGETSELSKILGREAIARIKESGEMTLSERMRQEKLLPLQIEREDLANTVGPDHPAMQTLVNRIKVLEQSIDEIARSEEALKQRLEEARSAADGEALEGTPEQEMQRRVRLSVFAIRQQLQAVEQEAELVREAYEREIEAAKEESTAEMKSAQFAREIQRQQDLYDRIVARLDEVNLMSEEAGLKVFPLDVAKPGYQFAPSLPKSLLMGGFLGCLLAGGLALLREMSDRSYHSAREIAAHTNLPVIGHIPELQTQRLVGEDARSKWDSRLYTVFNSKGTKAEAFRAVRTAIYFSNQSGQNQVLQVTSATPGEGKSTIAANLAVSIAQSGKRVLLVDTDFRRPRVHQLFGMQADKGFAWAIEQTEKSGTMTDAAYEEALIKTDLPNLSLMLAGKRPDNPAELLSSSAFAEVLDTLRGKYDMIILDTPPLLAVTDPSNVVSRADGVVMVIRLQKNVKPAVAQATRMLETLEANVLGIVVNGVGSRQAGDYGKQSDREGHDNYGSSYQYGYGYSYGSATDGKYSEYYDDDKPKRSGKAKKAESIG